MSEYRKKPVVVEAHQLIDDLRNHTKVATWITVNGGDVDVPFAEPCLYIATLEGRMRADIGDWIIKGVKGEFYPCKPDIFEATYEPADDARVSGKTLGQVGYEALQALLWVDYARTDWTHPAVDRARPAWETAMQVVAAHAAGTTAEDDSAAEITRLRGDLADAEAEIARWPRCPAGCRCRVGTNDADALECGCDGPCTGGKADPQPARELAAAMGEARKVADAANAVLDAFTRGSAGWTARLSGVTLMRAYKAIGRPVPPQLSHLEGQ